VMIPRDFITSWIKSNANLRKIESFIKWDHKYEMWNEKQIKF
jgi:hypothetical protein